MRSSAMRVICAASGVSLLVAAVLLVSSGSAAAALATSLLGGALLTFSRFEPRPRGAASDDELRMLRNAALLCFSVAVGLYVFALFAGPRRSDLTESAASLSAAIWIVAMLLTFAFALFAVRRRAMLHHP